MNEITRIDPGPRISEAVIHNGTVYLAGQVAEKTGKGTVAEQMAEVLSFVDEGLAKAGTNKSKILFATIYLLDIKTFAEMNTVWEQWILPGHAPARATLEAKLASPNYKVEVVVTAAV